MAAPICILLLMGLVLLTFNPTKANTDWYQRLRRPQWLKNHPWIPLIWLVIYVAIAASCLLTWFSTDNSYWVASFLLLLLLLKVSPWFLARSRKPQIGALVSLVPWLVALVMTILLMPISNSAALALMPLLLWAPLEAMAIWQMKKLNS